MVAFEVAVDDEASEVAAGAAVEVAVEDSDDGASVVAAEDSVDDSDDPASEAVTAASDELSEAVLVPVLEELEPQAASDRASIPDRIAAPIDFFIVPPNFPQIP